MKNDLRYALGPVFLALMIGICWWLLQPAVRDLNQPLTSPPPTQIKPAPLPPVPVFTPKPAQVAPPVIHPAPINSTTPTAAPPNSESSDPRLALNTALPDFIRLVEAGDFVTTVANYLQLSPDTSPMQFAAALQQSPNFPQLVQTALNTMRAAQNLTPALNDAGDIATYTLPAPVDGKTIVRWKKIDNKWILNAIDN